MTESNPNSRLEAFCDGVFAIALTLLIFDIRIPSSETINSTSDLWLALQKIFPSVFAFLLSFAVIFITWVNHHATLKMVNKSSSTFIYANGFLLLTVVIIPFPTALLGEYLFTELAAPAVILYSAVDVLQAIGWILMSRVGLKLTKNDKAAQVLHSNQRNGFFAAGIYTLCAISAIWFPLAVALMLSAIWFGWLIYGIRIKTE